MRDDSIGPMNAENVEAFDVWVFHSEELVVSIVSNLAPWNATTEAYQISDEGNFC